MWWVADEHIHLQGSYACTIHLGCELCSSWASTYFYGWLGICVGLCTFLPVHVCSKVLHTIIQCTFIYLCTQCTDSALPHAYSTYTLCIHVWSCNPVLKKLGLQQVSLPCQVNRNHLSSALRRLVLDTHMPTGQQATLLRSAQVISIRCSSQTWLC